MLPRIAEAEPIDPRLDAPKGEIVVVVGPGEEVQATEADADAALIDALRTLSTGDAASAKREYERVLKLGGIPCQTQEARVKLGTETR